MSKIQYLRFILLWIITIFLLIFIKKSSAENLIAPESFKTFIVYFPLLLAMSLMVFRGYLDFSIIGWFTLFSVSYHYFSSLGAFSLSLFIAALALVTLIIFYAFLLIWVKFPSFVLSVLFVVFSLTLQHIIMPNPTPVTEAALLSSDTMVNILNPSHFKFYLLLLLGIIFMWLAFHLLFRILQKPAIHVQKEDKNTSLLLFIFYIISAAIAVFLQSKLNLAATQNPINSVYYTIFNQIIFFFAALSLAGFSFVGGKSASLHAIPSLIILLLTQQILTQAGLNNMRIALYWLPLMPFIILAISILFDRAWFKRYRMLLSVPSEPLILSSAEE